MPTKLPLGVPPQPGQRGLLAVPRGSPAADVPPAWGCTAALWAPGSFGLASRVHIELRSTLSLVSAGPASLGRAPRWGPSPCVHAPALWLMHGGSFSGALLSTRVGRPHLLQAPREVARLWGLGEAGCSCLYRPPPLASRHSFFFLCYHRTARKT